MKNIELLKSFSFFDIFNEEEAERLARKLIQNNATARTFKQGSN